MSRTPSARERPRARLFSRASIAVMSAKTDKTSKVATRNAATSNAATSKAATRDAATSKAATSKVATRNAATRRGPADSATLHPLGTVLPGSDGRSWRVIATKAGTHRWSPAAAGGCAPCALAAVALLGGRGGPGAPKPARKAPAPSATGFDVGTKKKGLDGRMWAVTADVRGVRRWAPVAKK